MFFTTKWRVVSFEFGTKSKLYNYDEAEKRLMRARRLGIECYLSHETVYL